jgi:hypothetical protein
MSKVSIEIPLTWGKHLREVLEAIRIQTYQDYKIIIASSLRNGSYLDLVREYDVQLTYCGPNILEKRYSAHAISSGDNSLLLDETRIPARDLLYRLQKIDTDMVIVGEKDIGKSFWVRMSNLDKVNSMECNKIDMSSGFLLPRYFRFDLLTESLRNVRQNIDDSTFKSILMEDHQLISFEAFKLSSSVHLLRDELISHYGDTTLRSIIGKYHRYGKYHKILKNTCYNELLKPSKRIRKICLGSRIGLYTFYAARGIPFIMGYYFF